MPTVINGIGTWYYGKRRIHTLKGTCSFCGSQTDLLSYDTTLFFVVVFVPVIPLGQKRILEQCSVCQKHRVLGLAKWAEAKERDGGALLEKLRADPHNRDAIMQAIAFALAYQDEPLFNNIVETLAGERTDDAAIQNQLGHAYAYFARWPQAEEAFRNSLAVADNDAVREQLAWALLKQDRPDEARPCLQHVIDKKLRDSAGTVYFLVKGYQAPGRHDESLEIMDERDQAFPDWAALKEYQQQRKTSTRYRGTHKRIRSDFLQGRGKTGYREGGWSARVPKLIAALVLLGLLGLYLGSAVYIGQSRKVFVVNGTGKAYTAVIAGRELNVPPNAAFPIHIAEGDVQVAFKDARLAFPPVVGRIESSFWTRPFTGHTFVINPDQSAILVEEEIFYAKANPPLGAPPVIHVGHAFYTLSGVDYEFQNFPPTMQIRENSQVRKTRVGLASHLDPELRLDILLGLEQQAQVPLCKRLLQIDPLDTAILYFLTGRLSPEESLKYLETRLDDRPILVEWHRLFQSQMDRMHPETDLVPRYRKLVADTKSHPDALYLLGRIEPDIDAGEKLVQQAAAALPPSGNAIFALGYRALCAARFAEARDLLEKALPHLTEKSQARKFLQDAQLANGDYDRLLQALQIDAQAPGRKLQAMAQIMRIQAIRGDLGTARQKLAEVLQISPVEARATIEQAVRSLLALSENNVEGYLKAIGTTPVFEAALLRGQLQQAGDLAALATQNADALHGLLYLEATRKGAKDIADAQWQALLTDLGKRGRESRQFAALLSGKHPPDSKLAFRLAIEPSSKRVLLAVLAQRDPGQARDLLRLARRLNFQHDAISLCLSKHLAEGQP
ncbi:MAG: hypothetical protein FJ271_16220 [Planctomycetes bacterium]|nr:hypothetical protein [Planctomycetota bacterium]